MLAAVAAAMLPTLRSAFPIGAHDQLIRAATVPDEDEALRVALRWLAENDIDAVTFREHRLLFAVMDRFGARLAGHAAYPRLVGLQRMLWSRAAMGRREVEPALGRLVAEGVPVMAIKGAARIASDQSSTRARAGWDTDIAVPRGRMGDAFDVLVADDWTPRGGPSPHYVRTHLGVMRSLNLYRGRVGDIDLHGSPFHPGHGGEREDEALWRRTVPARLDGHAVLCPAPEDSLAIAIGHGGISAHEHSDWMVDAVAFMSAPEFDWDLFMQIADARSLQTPAAIALAYLAGQCDQPVPAGVVATLEEAARSSPLAHVAGHLLARPREREGLVGRLARRAVEKSRKRASQRADPLPPDRCLRVRRGAAPPLQVSAPLVTEHTLELPADGRVGGAWHLRAVIQVPVPSVARRIELEVNTPDFHLARVRARKWDRRAGTLVFSIEGMLDVPEQAASVILQARPARLVRPQDGPAHAARYAALPFRVLAAELTRTVSR